MKKINKKQVVKKSKKVVKKQAVKKAKLHKKIKKISAIKKIVKKQTVKKVKPVITITDKTINQFKTLTEKKEYHEFIKVVDMLNQRYASEKKYEDFNSYVELVKKYVPAELKLVKMTKKMNDFFIRLNYKKSVVALVNVTPRAVYTNLLLERF